jgi:hypothetical protein
MNLQELQSAYATAFVKWIESVSWAYDTESYHRKHLSIFQNYIFVLENYESCEYSEFEILCKINKLTTEYMENCGDKLNSTQVTNLVKKLWLTDLELVLNDDERHSTDTDNTVGIALTWSNTNKTYTPTITVYNKSWANSVFGTTPAGTYAYLTNYVTSVKSRKIFTGELQLAGSLNDLGINFSTVTASNWSPIGFLTGTDFPAADKIISGTIHKVGSTILKSDIIIRTTGYIDIRFTLISGTYPTGVQLMSGDYISFEGLILS